MTLAIKDQQILVLGLGDTGLSALRWLHRRGARLTVADTRSAPPGLESLKTELPVVKMHLGPLTPSLFEQIDSIVISPGVPLAEPLVQAAIQRGIPVVGDVELFAQHVPSRAKVIGITGSNGKSTVTALVGEMCQHAGLNTVVAGNIGLPVLDALDNNDADIYVLELSSFQLETTSSLKLNSAAVLNVTEDHMDRYQGMNDYAAAKARILKHAEVKVLNREDEYCRNMATAEGVTFGLDAPNNVRDFGIIHHQGADWLAEGDTPLIESSALIIAGQHNAANALAALALARAAHIPYASLIETLKTFRGLPHRVEWVAEISGIHFYDDSKGTNVGATCAALAGLPQKVVLIAGGDGKGQDFSPLKNPVRENARAVVLIGRDAPQISHTLAETGVEIQSAETLEAAVNKAFELAQPGDTVLLSPACASWDMFKNYVHRAEVFKSAVDALKGDAA